MEADIGGVLTMVFCEKIERRGETLEGFFWRGLQAPTGFCIYTNIADNLQ